MPLKFSVLSERRVYSPYGMNGGQDGSVGKNYWIRKNDDGGEQWISLGGKAVVNLRTGDRMQINTPGECIVPSTKSYTEASVRWWWMGKAVAEKYRVRLKAEAEDLR
jgi:N-methylhydantoinase B/oxoprolinase/acetone carboxylase alpha subunit